MKLAYLASRVTLPGSLDRRIDAYEHDQMMSALNAAMVEMNAGSITDRSWDDASVDWVSYDAVIIGSTWDYWDRHDQFLAVLARIESQTRLLNPASLVRWNIRKTYLRELEQKGAKLIPTLWLDEATVETIEAAFDTFQSDDIVCKRQIGAGADGQHRLRRGEPIPEMPHAMMVQPFLSSIQSEGEFSFIFIDGEFSHALIKRAASGDYRIQATYGGVEEAITPRADDINAAKTIINTLDEAPLYGRVDMVRGPNGELLLMELELIEPFLYPLQGPELAPRLISALQRRLA